MYNTISNKYLSVLNGDSPISPSFKKGQIVSGTVAKLYPNHQAEVKIGGLKLIAQLQAALNIEEKYWFQVEATEPGIRLKVVANNTGTSHSQSLKALLEAVGLKTSKDRLSVLHMLMEAPTPPSKKQIVQTIRLTEEIGKKELNQLILKEIINRDLPVTPAIYKAFNRVSTLPLTQQMTDLTEELNSLKNLHSSERQIQQKLEQLLGRAFEGTNNQLINRSMLLESVSGEKVDVSHFISKPGSDELKTNLHDLKRILNEQLPLEPYLKKHFAQFITLLIDSKKETNNESTVPKLEYLYKQLTDNKVFQKVSAVNEFLTPQLKNDTHQLKQWTEIDESIIHNLKNIAEKQLNQRSVLTLMEEVQRLESNSVLLNDPKLYFLTKLKTVQSHIGFQYEAELGAHLKNKGNGFIENTLKGLLLQASHTSTSSVIMEKIDTMIQTINGMQLSAVQQNENYLQFSMQLPGGQYSQNKDILLNFESKKTKTGEIDPSYCRILFYLSLERIEETIVDMNIMNRNINLTIYNAKESLEKFLPFKPMLEAALSKLDYSLTSLSVKQMSDKQTEITFTSKKSPVYPIKGVDFRI